MSTTQSHRCWSVVALLTTSLVAAASSTSPAQSLQTKQVMRDKLTESQSLLAALVTSNWAALDRHGRALEAVTRQPAWDVMRLPEFYEYTVAFQRSSKALVDAAEMRDQSTAVKAYNGLVASCVECHAYVARARIARVQ
jgi:hypothetical protein